MSEPIWRIDAALTFVPYNHGIDDSCDAVNHRENRSSRVVVFQLTNLSQCPAPQGVTRLFRSDTEHTGAMTNPYTPTDATLIEPHNVVRGRSALNAALAGCRNGLLWSLAVMLPISFLVVPAIPRRMTQDSAGNIVAPAESVGYLGMINAMFCFVAPIAAIWTLSAGAVGLIRYTRSRGMLPRATPLEESGEPLDATQSGGVV